MNLLLVLSLLAAVSIDGADHVADGRHALSLRPTVSQSQGTVWYARKGEHGQLDSFTGRYRLNGSGPIPGVDLSLTHRWTLEPDLFGTPRWHFDYDYLLKSDSRYGVYAEYEPGSKGLSFSVIRSFQIDTAGNQESRISGRQHHLLTGEVITFQEGMLSELTWNPPPGFVKRSNWTNRIREKPRTVYRTDLLKKDWYGWGEDGSYFVLSLEAGDDWDTGDARLFIQLDGKTNSPTYVYARGKFNIELRSTPDALLIELPMTRVFRARGLGRQLTWTASDTSSAATGIDLCVPLDDRALRDDVLTMYVSAAYFVNEQGKYEQRYNDDGTLFRSATQQLVGRGLGVTSGTTCFLRPGRMFAGSDSSLRSEKELIAAMESSPPPGFKLRPRQEVYVVAKPAIVGTDAINSMSNQELREFIDYAYENDSYEDAIQGCNRLIGNDRNDWYAFKMRGHCYFAQKQYPMAIADYDALIKLRPSVSNIVFRANANLRLNRYADALQDYKQANQLAPNDAQVYNAGAWIWATCPDASVRDGRKAISAAKKACELTSFQNADYVDTLAAAYAEAGDFQKAVDFQQDANKKYTGLALVGANKRLKLYQQRQPYREP